MSKFCVLTVVDDESLKEYCCCGNFQSFGNVIIVGIGGQLLRDDGQWALAESRY